VSWLVRHHVEEGRDKQNHSHWGGDLGEVDEAADTIERGKMPPSQYTLIHRDADLSAEEEQVLIDAFEQLEDQADDGGDDHGGSNRGRG
jgi:hypothetical protein